jgi:hypothetical protein
MHVETINALTSGTTSPMFAAFKLDKRISFIRPYDPKAPMAQGYRHAVIRYRETGKQTVSKTAQMVTIPQVTLSDDYLMPEKASQVLVGILEDQQDIMLRAFIDNGISVIEWESVSIDNCLDSLTAVRISQRLTKEQVENWVNVALVDSLRVRGKQNAESKGYVVDSEKFLAQIAGTIAAYRERFARLAAPVPNLDQNAAQALVNMLLVAKVDDDISRSLSKKLHAILHPVVLESGDL